MYVMSDNHGLVWWTELMTRDLERAVKYYADTCGWSYDTMDMMDGSGTYYVARVGDRPVAGLMDMSSMQHLAEVPPHWFSYFAVDDVEAAVGATRAAGGQVMREPFDVAGIGRIAILTDPIGAAMGLITPAPKG